MLVDELFISLGIKPEGVRRGMQQAEGFVQSGLDSVKGMFAGFAAAAGLSSMFTSYVDGAKSLDKYSRMLNISAESLQSWRGAAEAVGAEAESLDEMLIDMTEHLSDMVHNGSGPAQEVFSALGISAKDASGNIKPATDILLEFAKAGESLSKEQMLAYGKIFGFDKQVIELLQKGKAGLEDLIKVEKELAVFQQEDLAIAKEASSANRVMLKNLQSLSAVIMRALVPAYSAVVSWLTKGVKWIRENQQIVAIFAGIITAAFIPALFGVAKAGAAAMLPFLPLIAIVAALALVIDDLVTYVNGGKSAFEGFWSIFGTGEEISQNLAAAFEMVKTVLNTLLDAAKTVAVELWDSFGPAIQNIGDMLKGLATLIVGVFSGDFDKIAEGFKTLFFGIVDFIKNMFLGLVDVLGKIFAKPAKAMYDAIAGAFAAVVAYIKHIFQTAIDYIVDKLKAPLNAVKKGFGAVGNFFGLGDDDDEDDDDDNDDDDKPKKTTNIKETNTNEDASADSSDKDKFFQAYTETANADNKKEQSEAQADKENIGDILEPKPTQGIEKRDNRDPLASIHDEIEKMEAEDAAKAQKAANPAPLPQYGVTGATAPAVIEPQAAAAPAPVNNNVQNTTTVGAVTINTAATDAKGIAGAMGKEMRKTSFVNAANTGYNAK